MPAIAIIHDETLGSDTASFDVTSIPSGYSALWVVLQGRGTKSATAVFVYCRMNNDSAAHYHWEDIYGVNTTNASVGTAGDTKILIGQIPAASAPTSYAAMLTVNLADYAGTTFFKTLVAQFGHSRSSSVADQILEHTYGIWLDTSAIDRLTIYPDSNNFKAGTRLTIYGLPSSATDQKISDLSAITTLAGTEEFVVAASGVSNKITAANLRKEVGQELAYAEFTSDFNTSAHAANAATAIVTAPAITLDGSTAIIVEFFCVVVTNASENIYTVLYDGSTELGGLTQHFVDGSNHGITPVNGRRKLTPSAGSHTFSIRGWTGTGTATYYAGSGAAGTRMPGFIRITRA